MASRSICSIFILGMSVPAIMVIGCSLHKVNKDISLLVEHSDTYSLTVEGIEPQGRWWEAFNDISLNGLVEVALSDNLTLKQARSRIEQSMAADKHAASFLYPDLTGKASEEQEWKGRNKPEDTYNAGLALSWEIDLWGRLSSARKSAAYEILASREELEAAAILLTARVAGTYFEIIEQNLQLELLGRQIKSGETLLELIELRFGYGEASVVDVFQQRQQLASTRARLPVVRSRLRTLENRLHVQLGRPPVSKPMELANEFPELPDLPLTGVPLDLLNKRPDLRRIYNQLLAIDYSVAEAMADRFPKIELNGSAVFTDGFSTEDRLLNLLLEAAGPILDWDRRSSEVRKREAMFKEELARYSHTYLTAIEEMENALWQEREWELMEKEINTSAAGKSLALREPHLRLVKAKVDKANSRLAAAELALKRTMVRSSFNSLVLEEFIDRGQLVSRQTALATLAGTDQFWVQVSVPVSVLQRISLPGDNGKTGSKTEVIFESLNGPAVVRHGYVLRLMGDLDPEGRMARVLIVIDDPLNLQEGTSKGRLLLGSYVKVKIDAGYFDKVYSIPRQAMREGDVIWVQDNEDKLQIRPVQIVWRRKDEVLAKIDFKEGDRLILSRLQSPLPGIAVRDVNK